MRTVKKIMQLETTKNWKIKRKTKFSERKIWKNKGKIREDNRNINNARQTEKKRSVTEVVYKQKERGV